MAVNKRANLYTSTLGNTDASANQLSEIVNVSEADKICIHFQVTGAPTGTIYLDISNGLGTDANGNPSTFEEFDLIAFPAAGTHMWLDKDIPYTHLRLRWEQTGGAGALAGIITMKGDK